MQSNPRKLAVHNQGKTKVSTAGIINLRRFPSHVSSVVKGIGVKKIICDEEVLTEVCTNSRRLLYTAHPLPDPSTADTNPSLRLQWHSRAANWYLYLQLRCCPVQHKYTIQQDCSPWLAGTAGQDIVLKIVLAPNCRSKISFAVGILWSLTRFWWRCQSDSSIGHDDPLLSYRSLGTCLERDGAHVLPVGWLKLVTRLMIAIFKSELDFSHWAPASMQKVVSANWILPVTFPSLMYHCCSDLLLRVCLYRRTIISSVVLYIIKCILEIFSAGRV